MFGVKAELFKTLAHPTRIRALEVLADGERSVSDLAVEVEVELPHLSQQLAVLRKGGLVDTRREATTVYYAIRDPLLVDLLAVARRLLISGLEGSTALLDDLRAEDMP
ncbi:MAG: transcriptional regulator [Acidimicrobiales bacterium]|nr:MAG: transcriptional regulator [Acidimicrobiales bacterium]